MEIQTDLFKFDTKTEQEIGYYVYGLVDPRISKIFYIGKGVGNRVFSHGIVADRTDLETRKLNILREIKEANLEVELLILRHGMTEEESFLVESTLIDVLNYSGFDLTNIVSGHNASLYGISTVNELNQKYGAEPLKTISDDCIIININSTYDTAKKTKSVYEVTRGDWVISKTKTKTLKYALAEYKGFIVEVFEIESDGWEQFGKRKRFTGKVAGNNIRELYLNKRVVKKKGSANPIRYKL